MRVLMVAAPMTGHVLPLVPLATVLGGAGHDVVLATAGDAVDACPTAVRSENVAPGFELRRQFLSFPFRHPVLTRRAMAGRDDEGETVGPLMAGVGAGVPQLVLPGPGDRRTNAELVAARGAGIAAEMGEITSTALQRLVTDESLRAAAREVAAEMAAMPHPTELVPALAELAGISS